MRDDRNTQTPPDSLTTEKHSDQPKRPWANPHLRQMDIDRQTKGGLPGDGDGVGLGS
jgi:hypothetical protein